MVDSNLYQKYRSLVNIYRPDSQEKTVAGIDTGNQHSFINVGIASTV